MFQSFSDHTGSMDQQQDQEQRPLDPRLRRRELSPPPVMDVSGISMVLKMMAEEQQRAALVRERERREDKEKMELKEARDKERMDMLEAREKERFEWAEAREKERQDDRYAKEVKLLDLQSQMNRDIAASNRISQACERKRHDALLSITAHKEGESLVEFLELAERKLKVGAVEEDGWSAIVAAKLGSRLGAIWQTAAEKGG